MPTEDSLKCPNCYNPVYKGQVNCSKCGYPLKNLVGESRTFFKVLVRVMMYSGIGILVFTVIAIIVRTFLVS